MTGARGDTTMSHFYHIDVLLLHLDWRIPFPFTHVDLGRRYLHPENVISLLLQRTVGDILI
jgi:hypothetical protein